MNNKKHILTLGLVTISIFSIVFLCIFILGELQEAKDKVAVYEAFSAAYEELSDPQKDITKIFEVYNEDAYCHSGDLIIYDFDMISDKYVDVIRDVPIKYSITCEPDKKSTNIRLSVNDNALNSSLHLDSYIDESDIVFGVDEFYDGYFMIPNENIRENYNQSLLYNLFGDILALVPNSASINLYGDERENQPVFSEFLKNYQLDGTLLKFFDDISVKKTDVQKDFFVGDTYITTTAYNIVLSKSLVDDVLEVFAEYLGIDRNELPKAGKIKLICYISADNRLRGIETDIPIEYEGETYPANLLVSFKDNDSILKQILCEVSTDDIPDIANYDIKVLINNSFSGEVHKCTIIGALYKPQSSRLFEIQMNRDLVNNGFNTDIAVNIDGLSGRINYNCQALSEDEAIMKPQEYHNIYELNLWEILNIYSSADWSFIN